MRHTKVTIRNVTGIGSGVSTELAMLSLQKLMGKDDRFLTLLEAAAAEARHSVKALIEGLHSREGAPALEEFVLARRAEKQIAEQISHELVRTFVTELEREDI